MGHGDGPGPVGIILMPDHDAAVMRRFVEYLIVPEAYWSIEQLSRRDSESRMPQDVVQSRRDAPCSECVKEYLIGIGRFVCVEFVKQVVTGMCGIYQLGELAAQGFDLRFVEYFNSREVAVFFVEVYLLLGEPVFFPVSCGKQIAYRRTIA